MLLAELIEIIKRLRMITLAKMEMVEEMKHTLYFKILLFLFILIYPAVLHRRDY